jgi:hypothetical protein
MLPNTVMMATMIIPFIETPFVLATLKSGQGWRPAAPRTSML